MIVQDASKATSDTREFFMAGGHRLYAQRLGETKQNTPTLVFLHGGLDCIDMWRGFPEQMVAATELSAVVYERWGHGHSDPLTLPKRVDHRQREANGTLGEVMTAFELEEVILLGHSYGATLALLGAAYHPDKVRAVVSIAPQLVMHPVCLEGVAEAVKAYEHGGLKLQLEKYHGDNTEALFRGWSNSVSSPEYAGTRFDRELSAIRCPVQVIVGDQDAYGYQPNLDEIDQCVRTGLVRTVIIPDAGHHPHWQNAQQITDILAPFIREHAIQGS